MGRLAHALPPAFRSAQHSKDDRTVHPLRRPCGRRAIKLTPGQRLARRSSRSGHIALLAVENSGGPAPGLAGGRGDDLAGAAPSGAKRSDLQVGQFVKRDRRSRTREGHQGP